MLFRSRLIPHAIAMNEQLQTQDVGRTNYSACNCNEKTTSEDVRRWMEDMEGQLRGQLLRSMENMKGQLRGQLLLLSEHNNLLALLQERCLPLPEYSLEAPQ